MRQLSHIMVFLPLEKIANSGRDSFLFLLILALNLFMGGYSCFNFKEFFPRSLAVEGGV